MSIKPSGLNQDGFDFNNDGILDPFIPIHEDDYSAPKVVIENGKEYSIEEKSAYYFYTPHLEIKRENGDTEDIEFSLKNPCNEKPVSEGAKIVNTLWGYDKIYRSLPFFNSTGQIAFFPKQQVLIKGQDGINEIKALQINITADYSSQKFPPELSAKPFEILLNNCKTQSPTEVTWATAAGQRVDAQIVIGLAECLKGSGKKCTTLKKAANDAEKTLAKFFRESHKKARREKNLSNELIAQHVEEFRKKESERKGPFQSLSVDTSFRYAIEATLFQYLNNSK